MAYNKIIYKGDTLIDLTADTVTPETLAEGTTAHARNGEIIVGSMAGGDTGGGNFKKKFMSFVRVKKTSSMNKYDFVATLNSAIGNDTTGVTSSDEEILPTKTYDGIKISDFETKVHLYFIEDENDLFIYGDSSGSGTNEWVSMSTILGAEFGGVLTNIDINQMSPNVLYVLFYYVEAE
jgi:hypothetical protein